MTRQEGSPEQQAKIVAAAHAAASWARARRASWTDDALPLPRPNPGESDPPATHYARLHDVTQANRPPTVPSSTQIEPVSTPAARDRALFRALASRARALSSKARPLSIPKARASALAGRVALAAAGVAALVVLVRYAPSLWVAARTSPRVSSPSNKRETPAAPADGASAAPRKTTGGLSILSTPPGARVLLDGAVRGVTPLSLRDVSVGRHLIVLQSPMGIVRRPVTVAADAVAEVNETIIAAAVAVYAPFELSITEGTHALRPDDRNEIMLPAGPHDLRLANRALGFEEVRHVDLTPGQWLALSVTPPSSTVTVNASEAAEVWLDGIPVGETPLTDRPVALGTHEILVKRAAGGERRFTTTVTVKPFALFVDFSK